MLCFCNKIVVPSNINILTPNSCFTKWTHSKIPYVCYLLHFAYLALNLENSIQLILSKKEKIILKTFFRGVCSTEEKNQFE